LKKKKEHSMVRRFTRFAYPSVGVVTFVFVITVSLLFGMALQSRAAGQVKASDFLATCEQCVNPNTGS